MVLQPHPPCLFCVNLFACHTVLFVLSQMDCTADGNKEIKDKMGIKGFPSFRVRFSIAIFFTR